MLTEKQILEIREHLEKAQNPLFFFDNDNDGLCSFLLLRRFIKTGKGVAVKGAHHLNLNYYRRVDELKPDYIFILDIPVVQKEFLEKVKQENLPIVWIDHHDVDRIQDEEIYYYNPYHNDKTNEPVTYLCYKITNKKEDNWIGVIGCISDCYLPDFYSDFEKKYPELSKKNIKSAFDLLYNSEIGKIAKILDFALKDRTSNVVNMLKFMMKVKGPRDILEENSYTRNILSHFKEMDIKYQKLISRARECVDGKIIYFQYGGDLSVSSNLSSQLSFEFPEKIIFVVYVKGDDANISLRGQKIDIRKITLEAIKGLDSARGGGHEHATGAKMSIDDLEKFKKKVEELVELE